MAALRHVAIMVDMTGIRFCDSAGLAVLVRAHRRAVAEGGELRVVIPGGGAVSRVFAITSLDRVGSLDEAVAPRPGAVIRPLRPRPPGRPVPGSPGRGRGGS